MMDRHEVAHGDPLHAGADLDDLADRLVPQHRRQLARDVPAVDVRAAGRAGEHAADHLARTARRPLDLNHHRRVETERSGRDHATAAMPAASTGCATPRSVTSAQTSSAGVTSNAGLRTAVPGHGQERAQRAPHLVRGALLDLDPVAVGQRQVERRRRPRGDERHARRARGQRQPVGPDLVRDVAVGGHAVEAGDDGVDLAAAQQPGGGGVDEQRMVDPEPAQLPDRQPRALQQRPRLAREHPHGAPVGERRDHPEPGPAARRGQRARVAVRHHRHRPPGGQRRVEQRGAVLAERGARGLVLGGDRLRRRACRARHPHRAGGEGRVAHALHRPGEVARGRPAGGQPLGAAPRARRATAPARPPSPSRTRRRRRSAAPRAPRAARSRRAVSSARSRTSTTSSAGRRV